MALKKGTTPRKPREKKPKEAESSKVKVSDKPQYRCLLCGKEYNLDVSNFYRIKNSKLWTHNDMFAPICRRCLLDTFNRLSTEYDQKSALMIICSYLDMPFINSVYTGYEVKGKDFVLGEYIRTVGMQQFNDRDFMSSYFAGELILNVLDSEDKRWSHKDKRAKNRVITIVGYDPFVGFKDEIRRTIFTLTDDYFNDESIVEDTQKLKAIIEIMVNHGQILTIDENINRIINDRATLDNSNIKDLIDIKKKLQDANTRLSDANGIATKGNSKGTTGASSLAYHVRKLSELDFTAAEVNMFDIETSEAMQQVADMSLRSVLNTIALGDNEYMDIIKTQTEKIDQLHKDLKQKEEECRKLKIEASGQKFKRVSLQ